MILPERLDAHALWRAVIDRAVKDLLCRTPEAHEAWEWLFLPSSFADVCDELGLLPEEFRAHLQRRGLHRPPELYRRRRHSERALQPGVGRGGWTAIRIATCIQCTHEFTAFKPDTRYCLPCHQLRHPWKRRRAA